MDRNISPLIQLVNKPTVLTSHKTAHRLLYMRYGQRLFYARKTLRKLTQPELADLANVSQGLISQLEASKTATGSQYTVRFARALGISEDWLSDEVGEVEPMHYKISDPRIAEAMRIMENLPDYAVDEAIKSLAGIANLVDHNKPNGTSG